MKQINLFETFAGIGSQYKALKNISKLMNWEINPVGFVEWYDKAIIGYMAIHYPNHKFDISDIDFKSIKSFSISSDSKKPINLANFEKLATHTHTPVKFLCKK